MSTAEIKQLFESQYTAIETRANIPIAKKEDMEVKASKFNLTLPKLRKKIT